MEIEQILLKELIFSLFNRLKSGNFTALAALVKQP